jgi:hypothetical protein
LGGNALNVQSTVASTPVVVNAGAGNDDIDVDANGAGDFADTVDLVRVESTRWSWRILATRMPWRRVM